LSEPESLGEIIKRSGLIGARQSGDALETLKGAWGKVVGEKFAARSRPSRIRRRTLTVVADGAAWASDISASKQEIIKAINSLLGKGVVERIRVISGKIED